MFVLGYMVCTQVYPDLTVVLAVKQHVFHHVSQPWVHTVCGARAVTVGGDERGGDRRGGRGRGER